MLIYGGSVNNSDYPANNCEKIFVHLDKEVYVTGETIRYKVYVLNEKSPSLIPESKILYFVLSDQKNGEQIHWRVNLNKSSLYGSYQLPINMNASAYELSVYTNRIRESVPENIFSQKLFILSLNKETPDSVNILIPNTVTYNPTREVTTPDDQPIIRLQNLKSEYRTNDKVVIEITVYNLQPGDTSNLSLSVTNETPFSAMLQHSNIVEQFSGYDKADRESCLRGLENYAYMLCGRVAQKSDGSPVKNAKIFLAVVDSISPKIMYSAGDSKGNFCFYLNQFYDNKEIILQLAENSENLDLLWYIDKKIIPSPKSSWKSIPLSPEQIAYFDQIKNIRLIDALYTEEIIEKKIPETIPGVNNFANPDLIIVPADFAELINFKEITVNLIPSIRLKYREDSYYLQTYNVNKGTLSENNLVLLNGVPFHDINYIVSLGSRDIQRIEVITSTFLAGGFAYDGVVSIFTHDAKIPETYLKKHTLLLQNAVTETDIENKNIKDVEPDQSLSHFPDFRNNLYWNPELKVSGNNKVTIEFATSKLVGIFDVKIQGITSSGIPLNAGVSFCVK